MPPLRIGIGMGKNDNDGDNDDKDNDIRGRCVGDDNDEGGGDDDDKQAAKRCNKLLERGGGDNGFQLSVLNMAGYDLYTLNRLYDEIVANNATYRRSSSSGGLTRETRSMGTAVLHDFASGLKSLLRFGAKPLELTQLIAKNKTGHGVFDTMLTEAKITKSADNLLKIGELPVTQMSHLVRRGDLSQLSKGLGYAGNVTEADVKAFSNLADFPEKTIKNIEELSAIGKKTNPEFNFTIERAGSLPKATLKRIGIIGDWVFKRLTGKKVLAIAGIYMGVKWYERALEERRGCWLLRHVNGTTSSCKLVSLSCANTSNKFHCESVADYDATNLPLALMYLISLNNEKTNALASALGFSSCAELDANFSKIMTTHHVEKLEKFVDDNKIRVPLSVACSLSNKNYEKNIPACRACDPFALPTSTQYRPLHGMADNISFSCVVDPNFSDVLGDISQAVGENVYRALAGLLSPFTRIIAVIVAVLVALVLLVAVIKTVLSNSMRNRF